MSPVQYINTTFLTTTPEPTSPTIKIIYQDAKQVAREAIHIRINSSALHCNTGKMYIPKIFSYLFGGYRSSNESNQVVDSDLPQGHTYLTIPSNRLFSA